MILPLLYYPDTRLRTLAKTVEVFDDALKTLINDMFDTMYDAKGIGLAATQVNYHVRVVVMDLAREKEPKAPMVFVNPVATPTTDELLVYEEGCLSIPSYYHDIERPKCVKIHAQNADGEPFSMDADGLLAVCIQHEIDHLNGVLFVDYLSKLKQSRARDKVAKVLREQKS